MKKISTIIPLIIILIFINLISILIIKNKEQYHIDEVWTFGLANSYNKPFLYNWINEKQIYENMPQKQDYFYSWHPSSEFEHYVSVQENQKFSYNSVFYNQACDVHPPLYYLIVHTICSFFPNNVSKWFLASINIFLIIPTLLLFFLLSKELTKSSKIAFFSVAFWGFSRAFINDIAFLRMYMLLTFFSVALAYVTHRFIKSESLKLLPLLLLINILGFLTQYYFYIFSFFITAFTCLYFLLKKNYKKLIIYSIWIIASVIIALLIFPAALNHVFHGYYSSEFINTILHIFAYVFLGIFYLNINLISDFIGIISVNEMTSIKTISIVFLLFFSSFVIIPMMLIPNKKNLYQNNVKPHIKDNCSYYIILISTIFSIILIGALSPNMNYFYDRYILFLLPFIVINIIHIIYTLIEKLSKKNPKYIIPLMILFVLICSLSSNLTVHNMYLGHQISDKSYETMLKGKNCFKILRKNNVIHVYSILFKETNMIYPALSLDSQLIDSIKENKFNDKDAYIIIPCLKYSKDYIESVLKSSNINFKFITSDFIYSEEELLDNPNYIYQIIY